VHQLDHRRGVLADRLERDFLDLLAADAAAGRADHAVHRAQFAFEAMQPGEDVVAPRQRRGEGGAEPALGPFHQLGFERVGEDEPQSAVGVAAGRAFTFQRLVEAQQFERRLQFAQPVHAHRGVGESLPELGEESGIVEAGEVLKRGQHRAALLRRQFARLLQQSRIDAMRIDGGGVHCGLTLSMSFRRAPWSGRERGFGGDT
jgi:hypothetical protein